MAKIEITPETLSAMIAQAVQAALGEHKAERIAAAREGKSERSMKNEILAVRAFKKAGFGDVKLHDDVKTYNRWIAAGYKVKPGEHAVKIKNLRLFHRSQVIEISGEEKAAEVAKMQEAIRKFNDKKNGQNAAVSA